MSNRFTIIDPRHDLEIAAVAPCPILICPGQRAEFVADDLALLAMCYGIEAVRAAKRFLQYRGVALHRLPFVLRSGRDAESVGGVFWSAEGIDKALEYGGHEKVLLVYDPRHLTPAWIIVDAACSSARRSELQRLYPTVVWANDESIKLSRLPPSEYRGGIGYDDYAHWVPGNPFEALILIMVIARPGYPLASEVRQMIADCSEPKWNTGTEEERAAVMKRVTDTTRLRLSD